MGKGMPRTQTSQRVNPINIHCTAPTYPFSAASPKSQCRINLVLDPDQGIQDHRPRLVHI